MMRKRIKIKMVDYGWPGYKPENEYIYKMLAKMYDVEFSDTPDYLIDGCFGYEHLKYDCVKILSNGENYVSNFNLFDYAIGHDYLTFGDRYARIPHFATYPEFQKLGEPRAYSADYLLNRKFCSFVVSNYLCDPLRDEFFRELSKYKKVDSGGRHLNNVGGPVADKLEFCKNYKFNIAFENSVTPGYTTEKVMQPLTVGSVPIYYGDPLVGLDFNEKCLVVVKNREDVKRAIEEIVYLDTHDDAYLEKFKEPCLVRSGDYYEKAFCEFLRNIVEQPLLGAKRLSKYGYQQSKRDVLRRFYEEDRILHIPINVLRKIKKGLVKFVIN